MDWILLVTIKITDKKDFLFHLISHRETLVFTYSIHSFLLNWDSFISLIYSYAWYKLSICCCFIYYWTLFVIWDNDENRKYTNWKRLHGNLSDDDEQTTHSFVLVPLVKVIVYTCSGLWENRSFENNKITSIFHQIFSISSSVFLQ